MHGTFQNGGSAFFGFRNLMCVVIGQNDRTYFGVKFD